MRSPACIPGLSRRDAAHGYATGRMVGFTLIELVIMIVVLSVIATIMAPMMLNSLKAYDINQSNVVTLGKLRYTTERLAREIRETAYDTANTRYFIASMTATNLQFTKNDGTVVTLNWTSPATTMTLRYSSPAIAATTLTDQVSSLALSYFKSDGTTAATGNADVAFVQITVVLQDANSGAYTQRTRVGLRSRQ
jgi:Tfp pilus assembly protein PilE